MPTDDLSSKIVQTKPCTRKGKNVSKSPVTITRSRRQANKRKIATVQIRASQNIAN